MVHKLVYLEFFLYICMKLVSIHLKLLMNRIEIIVTADTPSKANTSKPSSQSSKIWGSAWPAARPKTTTGSPSTSDMAIICLCRRPSATLLAVRSKPATTRPSASYTNAGSPLSWKSWKPNNNKFSLKSLTVWEEMFLLRFLWSKILQLY